MATDPWLIDDRAGPAPAPWRSRFDVVPAWQTLRLPLAGFTPYRFDGTLVAAELRRIGLVALAFDGQPFDAELYFARAAWSD